MERHLGPNSALRDSDDHRRSKTLVGSWTRNSEPPTHTHTPHTPFRPHPPNQWLFSAFILVGTPRTLETPGNRPPYPPACYAPGDDGVTCTPLAPRTSSCCRRHRTRPTCWRIASPPDHDLCGNGRPSGGNGCLK